MGRRLRGARRSGCELVSGRASGVVGALDALGVPSTAAVIDIGGGARSCQRLVERGFTDVTCSTSLARRLRPADDDWMRRWTFPCPSRRTTWRPGRQYDCWHDRAMFHFLVLDDERDAYLRTLHSAVTPAGFVILATFAPDGPPTCSGSRLSATRKRLQSILGSTFDVLETRREEHTTPRGALQRSRRSRCFRPELGCVSLPS